MPAVAGKVKMSNRSNLSWTSTAMRQPILQAPPHGRIWAETTRGSSVKLTLRSQMSWPLPGRRLKQRLRPGHLIPVALINDMLASCQISVGCMMICLALMVLTANAGKLQSGQI